MSGFSSSIGCRCLMVIALCFAMTIAHADDWPQLRGLHRDGISTEKWSPKGKLKPLWSADIGVGFSAVAVAGGRCVAMGNKDGRESVYCFNAATGEPQWQHNYSCPLQPMAHGGGPHASPTIDGDRVYTLSRAGDLKCLQLADGKVAWQISLVKAFRARAPQYGYSGSPLVVGDKLIVEVGASGASVVALNKTSGEVVWKSLSHECGYSSPVAFKVGTKEYVALFTGVGLAIIDPDTGQEARWFTWKTSDINAALPVIDGAKAFVITASAGAGLIDFSAAPKLAWRNRKLRTLFQSAVLVDGYLYDFTGNPRSSSAGLCCVDIKTGDVKWKQPGGYGSVIVVGGNLLALTEDGVLYVAKPSPRGFEPTFQARVQSGRCWTVPSFANGRLYIRNAQGRLLCLQ